MEEFRLGSALNPRAHRVCADDSVSEEYVYGLPAARCCAVGYVSAMREDVRKQFDGLCMNCMQVHLGVGGAGEVKDVM